MMLLQRDNENMEKGYKKGRGNLCFELVLEDKLSIAEAAAKMSMSEEAFSEEYETWKKENVINN